VKVQKLAQTAKYFGIALGKDGTSQKGLLAM
jgi:hypothetical protein